MLLLKEYIRCCIKEASGYNQLNQVIKRLNDVVGEYNRENRSYAVWHELVEIAEGMGLEEIASGSYRKVYGSKSEDWVLKIAYGFDNEDYKFALSVNLDELKIGEGEHGLGSRDLFVKVLGSDKLNSLPTWIITERVVVLYTAEDHFSLDDMEKIFPTFWNVLKENSPYKNSVRNFCSFIADVMDALGQVSIPSYSSSRVPKQDLYDAIKEGNTYDEESIVDFDEVVFEEDALKILKACAFNIPLDMHDENIGIVKTNIPSPKDIVVLDYMID